MCARVEIDVGRKRGGGRVSPWPCGRRMSAPPGSSFPGRRGTGGRGGGICSGRCCPLPPPAHPRFPQLLSFCLREKEERAGPLPSPFTPRKAGPLLRSGNFLTTWAPRTPAQPGIGRHRRAPGPGSRRWPPPRSRAGPALVPAAALRDRERHLSPPQPPPACLGSSLAGLGEAGAAMRPRAPQPGSAGGCRSRAAVPEPSAPSRWCTGRSVGPAGWRCQEVAAAGGLPSPGSEPRGTPRLRGGTGLAAERPPGWRGLQVGEVSLSTATPPTGKP